MADETIPSAHTMLMFGAMAQNQFEQNGGFKPEDRNNIIESFNVSIKILGELTDKLLEDTERTLNWINEEDLVKLNSAFRLITFSRDALIYNTIMLQSGRLAIESLRAGLGVVPEENKNVD